MCSKTTDVFPQGTAIFEIIARDGDTGKPRELELDLVGDSLDFFVLEDARHDAASGLHTATLRTSEVNVIDREMEVRSLACVDNCM